MRTGRVGVVGAVAAGVVFLQVVTGGAPVSAGSREVVIGPDRSPVGAGAPVAPFGTPSARPFVAPVAVGGPRVRLSISATPAVTRRGARVTVTATLAERRSGAAVQRRRVLVYAVREPSRSWVLLGSVRTSTRGVAALTFTARTDLLVTLRFAGDRRYPGAASRTLFVDVAPSVTRLDRGLAAAVARARRDARRAGVDLRVNSGFRGWAEQQRMYRAAVRSYGSADAARRWVLPAQESTHVRGLAVDLGPPAAARWLAGRSARYGLCRTYANEPWHFEYRPAWIARSRGRCPAPVARPGDPAPFSPAPRVPA